MACCLFVAVGQRFPMLVDTANHVSGACQWHRIQSNVQCPENLHSGCLYFSITTFLEIWKCRGIWLRSGKRPRVRERSWNLCIWGNLIVAARQWSREFFSVWRVTTLLFISVRVLHICGLLYRVVHNNRNVHCHVYTVFFIFVMWQVKNGVLCPSWHRVGSLWRR